MEKFKQESHWEQKEATILEKMDRKVDGLLRLKEEVSSIDISESHEVVKEKLNGVYEGIKNEWSQEVIEQVNYCIDLMSKAHDIQLDINRTVLDEGDIGKGALLRGDELVVRRDALFDEVYNITSKHSDVLYMTEVYSVIKSLVEKNEKIVGYKGDKDRVIKEAVSERFSSDAEWREDEILTKEDVVDVVIDPFSASVVFESKAFDEIDEDASGLHMRESVFNYIRDSKDKNYVKDIIRHENTHNILDGTTIYAGPLSSPDGALKGRLTIITGLMDGKISFPFSYSDAKKQRARERIMRLHASDLIDYTHEEILAGLDEAKKSGFRGEINMTPQEILRHVLNKKSSVSVDFRRKTSSFSTAGNQLSRAVEVIQKYKPHVKDSEVAEHLDLLEKGIMSSFVDMVERVKLILSFAETIGPEAEERADILFHILKPSTYRHIESYLDYKYKENIDLYRSVNKIERGDFSLLVLRVLADGLSKQPELMDKVKNKHIPWEKIPYEMDECGVDIRSLDQIREYVSLLGVVMNSFSVSENLKDKTEHITASFFYENFMADVNNQFERMGEMYEKLTDVEKEIFQKEMVSYFNDFFFDDFNAEISSREDIKKMPLWNLVVKAGLQDTIGEMLEKLDKEHAF